MEIEDYLHFFPLLTLLYVYKVSRIPGELLFLLDHHPYYYYLRGGLSISGVDVSLFGHRAVVHNG